MEFEDIGSRCCITECNRRDFLPFTCDGCKKTFCFRHREFSAHKCQEGEKIRRGREATVCPLCDQVVPVKPGGCVNTEVERHIQKGCTQPTKSRCGKKGCRRKAHGIFGMHCSSCGNTYCVKHRSRDRHHCSGVCKGVTRNETLHLLHRDRLQRQVVVR